MFAAETGNDRRQDEMRDSDRSGQPHGACKIAGLSGGGQMKPRSSFGHFAGARHQRLCRLGRLQSAWDPREKLDPKLRFKRFDVSTDRGLALAQLARRAGQRACVSDGCERLCQGPVEWRSGIHLRISILHVLAIYIHD